MGDVILRDFNGNTLSSFWQDGLIDWEMFYSCLCMIISSPDSWAVFWYNENAPEGQGVFYPSSHNFPQPGTYTLLHPDGGRTSVVLTPLSTCPRHPTISNTPARTGHYRTRVHEHDPCCLVSGHMVVRNNWSCFKAAHIYPPAHDNEWVHRGYPTRITDPAPLTALSGSTKIDSIQNVILLHGDLHDGWDSYDFVNPNRRYAVIPFVPSYDDITGNVLKLDHIADSNLSPLDDLFRDHFLQGVLKNMKGAGEPTWDYEDALGGGMMDLSRLDIWGSKRGQEHLEFEMAYRLQAAQESAL